ncbi:MAG: sigma-70 family RNA polymerase sigma factor [Lachnospiraceae bacterium]|nr:sigma-70 family RNA polymerase sigma factor [Lachnospiraceae bacterium]
MRNNRFEGCFQKYQNLIMRIVLDKTSDYQLAQEILQQVFCEFYIRMDQVSPESEKAWLVRCTKNAVIDHLRGKQRWGELLVDTTTTEVGNLLVDETVTILEEQLDMQEFTKRILMEVKCVNEQWYEALTLCFVKELSYAEAAEISGVSSSVLRARVCRARAYIREKFWDEYRNKEN